MGDNRGIDAVDTLLGGMSSMFGRVMLWFGSSWACIVVGVLALLLDELISDVFYGYNPLDTLGAIDWGELLKGLFLLPFAWVWMSILCFGHWIGLIYLPFIVFGTWIFLATDHWEEELFFLNLIITPWATLAFTDEFPWGALLIYLSWGAAWGGVWWMRSRSGIEADFREKEVREVLGTEFSVLNHMAPARIELELEPPPPTVSVSIPIPGAPKPAAAPPRPEEPPA